MEKPKIKRIPRCEKIAHDISLSGNFKQIQKAKAKLAPIMLTLATVSDQEAPLVLSKAIDEYQISASIMYRGHIVWSRRRILTNLDKIIAVKQLYLSSRKVRWLRVKEKDAYLPDVPKDFRAILDDYFYDFLVQVCGSHPHYNKAGWIGIYPTLEDLKRFFRQNEQGKPVSKYIPAWKSDAKKIAEDIEVKLFPFRSYVKVHQKKLQEENGSSPFS